MSSPLVIIACKRPEEMALFLLSAFYQLSGTELYCMNLCGGQLLMLGVCKGSK